MATNIEQIIRQIEQEAPPVLTRVEIERITGGAIKAKSLANMDCLGGGIAERLTMGRKVFYPREAFIDWLRRRMAAEPMAKN
ncbi:hypothetical protein [Trichloromonas sp.]|uniref:hypothetical protein n=1 Tax=Trichloromonas sp. TaxID=3069249 RepID=UPI002A385DBE|nr:hypothetical protein [Trichloromonas sp.]